MVVNWWIVFSCAVCSSYGSMCQSNKVININKHTLVVLQNGNSAKITGGGGMEKKTVRGLNHSRVSFIPLEKLIMYNSHIDFQLMYNSVICYMVISHTLVHKIFMLTNYLSVKTDRPYIKVYWLVKLLMNIYQFVHTILICMV